MTLDELGAKRLLLREQLAAVEAEIAAHPDHIRSYFGGVDHPLVRRVTRVERASGWTDSRKNPCEWEGFRFTFDGVPYEVRDGSNWCSSVRDVVKVGSWDRWELSGGDPGGEAADVLDGVTPDHTGVGKALLILNGFIE